MAGKCCHRVTCCLSRLFREDEDDGSVRSTLGRVRHGIANAALPPATPGRARARNGRRVTCGRPFPAGPAPPTHSMVFPVAGRTLLLRAPKTSPGRGSGSTLSRRPHRSRLIRGQADRRGAGDAARRARRPHLQAKHLQTRRHAHTRTRAHTQTHAHPHLRPAPSQTTRAPPPCLRQRKGPRSRLSLTSSALWPGRVHCHPRRP